jgi:hypothetical protein
MFTPVLKSSAQSFAPSSGKERIILMDALRGLALLGIITANLASFSGYAYLSPEARQALPSFTLDKLVDPLLHVFIDSKFSTIFSMLFGIGFALQLEKARAKGVVFRPYFAKRMLLLLTLAVLHAYLLWFGDILRYYALAGLSLLLVAPGRKKAAVPAWCWPLSSRRSLYPQRSGVVFSAGTGDLSCRVFSTPSVTGTYGRYWLPTGSWMRSATSGRDSPDDCLHHGKVLIGFWMGKRGFSASPKSTGRCSNAGSGEDSCWVCRAVSPTGPLKPDN